MSRLIRAGASPPRTPDLADGRPDAHPPHPSDAPHAPHAGAPAVVPLDTSVAQPQSVPRGYTALSALARPVDASDFLRGLSGAHGPGIAGRPVPSARSPFHALADGKVPTHLLEQWQAHRADLAERTAQVLHGARDETIWPSGRPDAPPKDDE